MNIEKLLADRLSRIKHRKKYSMENKRNWKSIKISRKQFSRFILFEFDDGSSEFVVDMDVENFCKNIGMVNFSKSMDMVYNNIEVIIKSGKD